jgi:hypothetical protein
MKTPSRSALFIGLMIASACATASTRLTPHQCNAYPFKPAHGEVTHRDLMRELNELESVGYRPAVDNYSLDVTDARARLMAKYARDCQPDRHAATMPPNNG